MKEGPQQTTNFWYTYNEKQHFRIFNIWEVAHVKFSLLQEKSFTMLINLLTQNVSSHSLMKVITLSLSKIKWGHVWFKYEIFLQ